MTQSDPNQPPRIPYPQPWAHPYPGVPYMAHPRNPVPKRPGWLIPVVIGVIVIVAAVVLVAAGTAVAFLHSDKKESVTTAATAAGVSLPAGETPTPTATSTPMFPAGTTKLSPAQLYATLVAYPSGSHKVNPSGTSHGIMTLSQFAKRDYDDVKQATTYLSYYQFSSAATKVWATSNYQGHFFLTLIEFDGSPNNATSFVKDEADDDREARPAANKNGPLPGGLPGSYFMFNTPDTSGWRGITAATQVGNIVIEAEYDTKSTLTSTELNTLLALTQLQAARIE